MKLRAMPVDMIGWFDFKGQLNPVSFCFEIGNEKFKGKIRRVQERQTSRFGNLHMENYVCQVDLEGRETMAEFRYEKETHRWLLMKL